MGGGNSQAQNQEGTNDQVEDASPIAEERIARINPQFIDEDDMAWWKDVFYKFYADAKFVFDGGQIIKVNKAVLASKSEKFHQMFRKACRTGNSVRIEDYDLSTFQLFLDCLLGLQDFSEIDALLIFPVAFKYETKSFVRYCIDFLKPVALNENVCYTLNLGLICQYD